MTGREMQLRPHGGLEGRQGFFVHLVVYVLVGAMLVVVSMQTSPDYFWAKWPLMGWGIGLFVHALRSLVLQR